MSDELDAAVTAACETRDDGVLTLRCAEALRLAESLGVEVAAIAACCNANDVKIVHCQMGCF